MSVRSSTRLTVCAIFQQGVRTKIHVSNLMVIGIRDIGRGDSRYQPQLMMADFLQIIGRETRRLSRCWVAAVCSLTPRRWEIFDQERDRILFPFRT